MLSLNEFSAGEMNSAKPISLIRPLAEHDREVLVVGPSDKPIAVILGGEYAYRHFETAGSENWTGLIIPDLRVEVDEDSAFDGRFDRSPLGAAVRRETELVICVRQERQNGTTFIILASDLPSIGDQQAGFKRWQVVVGKGRSKRVIRAFDVSGLGEP